MSHNLTMDSIETVLGWNLPEKAFADAVTAHTGLIVGRYSD